MPSLRRIVLSALVTLVATHGLTGEVGAQVVPAPQTISPTPVVPNPVPVTPTPAPVAPTPPAATPTPVATPAPSVTSPAPTPTPGTQSTAPAPSAPGISVPGVEVVQPEPVAPKPSVNVKARPALKPAAAPVQAAAKPQAAPASPSAPAVSAAPPLSSSVPAIADTTGQVSLSPIGGAVAIEKYAGSVSQVSAAAIASGGSNNTTDALQARVPGVIVTDNSGNSFQQDLNYRGFNASPVAGTSQGLAVYQNGVRINEVFGDTVNFDQIPSIAIADIAVISGNPVYGLNAIGGAITLTMKDGFSFQGTEIDGRFGSFGRRQIAVQSGTRAGAVASYFAVESIRDDGWRDKGSSAVRRAYGDLGYRDERAEVHLNVTGAYNTLGASAAAPIELVRERYGSVFTTPQKIENKLFMVSLLGSLTVTPSTKVSGNVYYRQYRQKKVDGNISDTQACADDGAFAGLICFATPDNPLNLPQGGIPFDPTIFYGSLDRTSIDTDGYGGSGQVVEKSRFFGLGNQLLVGASVDIGRVTSRATSELGSIGQDLTVTGLGPILSDAGQVSEVDNVDSIKPVDLAVRTDYLGLYFTDTLDLTDWLSVTGGGRYNRAEIKLRDQGGISPELNGSHTYERFNPVIGAAIKLAPGTSFFGGYSEANRAPTPAELSCADPARPCLLANFLIADPPLKQVVSHTFETGLRSAPAPGFGGAGRFNWAVSLYRTQNDDDIISVASPVQGRGYFQNAGSTLRQGVDVSVGYKDDRWSAYAGYGFVDATFLTALQLASPNNPGANVVGCAGDPTTRCINVRPGDQLAGVPQHRFKAGFDYLLTSKWLVGADLVATSDQFLRGDENNSNPKLAGYATVNLHSSYDVTKDVQVYGLINNVFDNRYYLGGTYFDAAGVTNRTLTDNRTVVPGAPLSAYAGMKVKF